MYGSGTDAPSRHYFQKNEGRWRAPFVFAISDYDALDQASLSWLNRVRIGLMALLPKLVGAFAIDTSVDATSRIAEGKVVHTTRISKWGMPLYDATEVFSLDPNGKEIAIARRERMWPWPFFTHEEGRSHGEVEPGGRRARYAFAFFGVEMQLTGSIEDGGVRILQQTAFSHAEFLLRCIQRP